MPLTPPKKTILHCLALGAAGYLLFLAMGSIAGFFLPEIDIYPEIVGLASVRPELSFVYDWFKFLVCHIIGVVIFSALFYFFQLRYALLLMLLIPVFFGVYYFLPNNEPAKSITPHELPLDSGPYRFVPGAAHDYILELKITQDQVKQIYDQFKIQAINGDQTYLRLALVQNSKEMVEFFNINVPLKAEAGLTAKNTLEILYLFKIEASPAIIIPTFGLLSGKEGLPHSPVQKNRGQFKEGDRPEFDRAITFEGLYGEGSDRDNEKAYTMRTFDLSSLTSKPILILRVFGQPFNAVVSSTISAKLRALSPLTIISSFVYVAFFALLFIFLRAHLQPRQKRQ